MANIYEFHINTPTFNNLGYLKIVASITDKHDRSAPSDYHWKVLKCRIIIFSTSSILSCPDKSDIRQIHVVFNRIGDDYDRLTSLFIKLSLTQDNSIYEVTKEVYLECFRYTMSARLAPVWNVVGCNYYINNRNFLTSFGFQDGVKYHLSTHNDGIILVLKPIKINLVKSKEKFSPRQKIKVLPSLNEAIIEEFHNSLPKSGDFKCYKELRRHWKNIHGYRLPDEEHSYYTVRFWRGDPLTYPEICLTESLPIIIPTAKVADISIISRFINCLKQKMPHVMSFPLLIEPIHVRKNAECANNDKLVETQAVSLCTPSQSTSDL